MDSQQQSIEKPKTSSQAWSFFVCLIVCAVVIYIPYFMSQPNATDGEIVPWRPGNENYTIVWILLCVLIATSMFFVLKPNNDGQIEWNPIKWEETKQIKILLYLGILGACAAWSPVYRQNKSSGVTVFLWLLMMLAPLMILIRNDHQYALSSLAPLAIWALFQMGVNMREVELLSEQD